MRRTRHFFTPPSPRFRGWPPAHSVFSNPRSSGRSASVFLLLKNSKPAPLLKEAGLDFRSDPRRSSSNRVGRGLHIDRLIEVLALVVGFGHEPEVLGLVLVPAAAVGPFRP